MRARFRMDTSRPCPLRMGAGRSGEQLRFGTGEASTSRPWRSSRRLARLKRTTTALSPLAFFARRVSVVSPAGRNADGGGRRSPCRRGPDPS